MEIVKTNIEGLTIRINKVVRDKRGFLAEISRSAKDDDFLKLGIQNIYISVATEKKVARGGHFHKKNAENFLTLSGTTLWLFIDCRKESPTFNNFYSVILGSDKLQIETDISYYTLDDSKMAQTLIPPGVYHIFWPLTNASVMVLAIASEPFKEDREDHFTIDLNERKDIKNHLMKFGISV